jgi:hypothetical protein
MPRVIKSKDPEVRAAAEQFKRDVDRSIAKLQRDLRSGSFKFAPQRGVLKIKRSRSGEQKKDPRPIVVAPVGNRIVQRAILDTCQSEEAKIKRRLGALPAMIGTLTSVGGLPGRGVPEAIALISEAIAGGAKWFVRSDLKKFFQTIPKPHIERFLRSEITDERFVDFFMEALATELSNEAEVRELLHLFPTREVGVPQGSALSALSANIILAEFDAKLNGRGITTIRYLDDFVIVGPSKRVVLKAWNRAQLLLKCLGMECHDPSAGTGKAAMGEIAGGFDFLSFHIDGKNVYPSKEARTKLLSDLRDEIRIARRTIATVKDEPRRAEPRFVQSLALVDQQIRGWGDAFTSTTMRVVFSQLDAKIADMLDSFLAWFERLRRGRSVTHQRRLMGIALLIDTEDKRKVEHSDARLAPSK